jgi:trehalose 6-phosphate synthase
VGVLSAMKHTGGLWFGWSGHTKDKPAPEPTLVARDNVQFATIDLTPTDYERHYNGYCNATLWPLFHYFPGRFTYAQEHYESYQSVNALFARRLVGLLRPNDVVWVHDYHLIPFARNLRRLGFAGPIGFFLHIPFPHVQVLRVLPHYPDLLRDLCQYDLVGLHTADDVSSFQSAVEHVTATPTLLDAGEFQIGGRTVRVGAYPIGVDVDAIESAAAAAMAEDQVQRMVASLLGRKLLIGVDRLDYSKGLTQRLAAFGHFLERFPDYRGQVTYLQIAPLSRSDVLAYGEIRSTLEQTAGKLNGRYAEADWTPVRYLNRNYSHGTLAGFLRAAQVGLVTPVRDGMNLVAKEFVAAQDPQDPGVLVLSPLAGAARELTGALLANPYDRHGVAQALETALTMPLDERRQRHAQMVEVLRRNDIHAWSRRFVRDLLATHAGRDPVHGAPSGASFAAAGSETGGPR